MSVKITITIEVDDEGKVSVDTGQQVEDNPPGTPYPYSNDPVADHISHDFDQVAHDDNMPFTLVDNPTEVSLERLEPANIDDEATELIRERNERFARQFAENITKSPITGQTVTTLIDEGLLDAIDESAVHQEKEGAEGEK